MTTEPNDQEKRSRELADSIRRYLTALNTGGIAMTFAVAGSLADEKVNPDWTAWPIVAFVLGLTITGGSLFLAKHKALKRRDNPNRDFSNWYWRNFTYDLIALVVFVVGVGLGLWQLSCIRLS